MVYHPHVHFVVPGGGVKLDDQGHAIGWQATPENFLFHHGRLVRVYKAKLADHLRTCGLYDQVPADTWNKKFVVDIEPVGDITADAGNRVTQKRYPTWRTPISRAS